MIDEDQAVALATAAFERQGASASDYHVTVEPYHADAGKWIVWFDWKSPWPIPGGRSAVLVDRHSGHTEFLPGE